MQLDGDDIVTLMEQLRRKHHCARVGIALGISRRITVVTDISCRHVVTAGFRAVDIDDDAVIDGEVELELILARRFTRQVDCIAEISRGTLMRAVLSIVETGGDIIFAEPTIASAIYSEYHET